MAARPPEATSEPQPGRFRRLLQRLQERLSGRPDSEHEQAIIRIVVICGMYAYMLLAPFPPEQRGSVLFWSTLLFAVGFSLAIVIFAHILWQPGISPTRRLIGILVDTAGINSAMLIGGHLATPFYPLLLWIIFGHGFRYGNRYLFVAAGLSLLMFGTVLFLNSGLRAYTSLDVALVLSLVVLPAYVSILLKKLTDALERAEAASRAKSRFLATMSHEFRTPLNAILGTTQLLASEVAEAERREGMRTIESAARSLLGMVDALLRLARIESGRLDLETTRVDLDRFLDRILAMVRPTANAKRLDLRLELAPEVPSFVRTSEESLEHVLLNLLANAVKFTREGSIVLRVSAQADAAGLRLRFEVQDTGIGIPEEAQTRIFERFVQADEETRVRFGGSGLGLAIARELVELVGGTIGVESIPGSGSTFWFEVPAEVEDEPPATIEPGEGGVVVFGNALGSLAIAERLESLGLRARIAANRASVCESVGRFEGRRAILAIPPTDAAELGRLREELRVRFPGEPIALIAMGIAAGVDSKLPVLAQLAADADDRTLLRILRAALPPGTSERPKPEGEGVGAPHRGARILLAEDNRVNQKVIARLLEHCGHEVEVVDNGEDVLERLENERFDLVILDVNMPDTAGPEVVKLLRFTHDPASLPPLVALSADATPETRNHCLSLGFSRYLTKPVTREVLAATVAELVPENARTGTVRATAQRPADTTKEKNVQDGASGQDAKVIPHPAWVRSEADSVIDSARLRQIAELDGDGDFFEGLVRDFLEDGAALVAELQKAAESGDMRAWRQAAHALRSSAAHIGARGVWARTREWRELDDHALSMRAKAEARAVAEEFRRAQEALQRYLRSRAS